MRSTFKLCSSLAVILIFLASCSSRPLTKPRSEIIEEARDRGIPVRSIEHDAARFESEKVEHQQRLLAVIKKRSDDPAFNESYRLGPGDEIEINVFDVPELTKSVRIRESGFLTLPLVGAIEASGLTEEELDRELTSRLRSFVKQPEVSVFISNFGSQKVGVMGAVEAPGSYPLRKGENSVGELISAAGGLTEKAGNYVNFVPNEVTGLKNTSDPVARARLSFTSSRFSSRRSPKEAIEVPLASLLGTTGGIPLDIPIRGGDMIIVPEAGQVLVEGEVQKPGAHDLGRRVTLLGALAGAGGITYGAKIDEIELIREQESGEKLRLVVNLEKLLSGEQDDVPIRNGDLIRVPSDSGRRMRGDTFDGITRLINFGVGGSVRIAN